jgi:hypothetical protein
MPILLFQFLWKTVGTCPPLDPYGTELELIFPFGLVACGSDKNEGWLPSKIFIPPISILASMLPEDHDLCADAKDEHIRETKVLWNLALPDRVRK